MQETWVQALGWEDPLEEDMTTNTSIFAWKIPWTEESGGLQVSGVAKSWIQLSTHSHTHIFKRVCVCVCVYVCIESLWYIPETSITL